MNAPIVVKNREQGKSRAPQRPLRLFFALWPSQTLAHELHQLGSQMQGVCGGRVMRPDTIHMTLLFLGSTPADRLKSLMSVTEEVYGQAFDVRLDRVYGWRHNAIVYAAPSVIPSALSELVIDLRRRVEAAGVDFDAKAFKPHITLLRNTERMPGDQPSIALSWRIEEFVLVQSVPYEGRMKYEIIGRWPLSQALA